jgi:hypothetical protein
MIYGTTAAQKISPKNGFIKLDHAIMDTAAWEFVARTGAALLLLEIWRRYNGKNNGRISYSNREAQRRFKCGSHTAFNWFLDLQLAGFIVIAEKGYCDLKTGGNQATRWRLTMERCNGKEATREYLQFVAPES